MSTTEIIRPDGNISISGFTGSYTAVDDAIDYPAGGGTSDYLQSTTVGNVAEISFANPSLTGYVEHIHHRHVFWSGASRGYCRIELLDGATVLDSVDHTALLSDAWVTYDYTLPVPKLASALTDLRLRYTSIAPQQGGSLYISISQLYLVAEVGGAPAANPIKMII